MSSKAVIRDVGRVLDLPYGFCDQLSKLIPLEANKPLSLAGRSRPSRNSRKASREERSATSSNLAGRPRT